MTDLVGEGAPHHPPDNDIVQLGRPIALTESEWRGGRNKGSDRVPI